MLIDFGYGISHLLHSNPYFANFLPTPVDLEGFSAPPIIPGFENFGPEDSELPISFSATIISIPESTSMLSFLALGTLGAGSALKRKKSFKFTSQADRERFLNYRKHGGNDNDSAEAGGYAAAGAVTSAEIAATVGAMGLAVGSTVIAITAAPVVGFCLRH